MELKYGRSSSSKFAHRIFVLTWHGYYRMIESAGQRLRASIRSEVACVHRHRPTNRDSRDSVQLMQPPFSTTSIHPSGWISIPIGRIDLDLDSFSLKEFRGARRNFVSKRGRLAAISTRNFDVTSAVVMAPPHCPSRENFAFWKLFENVEHWPWMEQCPPRTKRSRASF